MNRGGGGSVCVAMQSGCFEPREGIAVEFWMTLWKVVFIVSVGAFSVMAVWVTIWGARDIKRLLTILKGDEKEEESRKG